MIAILWFDWLSKWTTIVSASICIRLALNPSWWCRGSALGCSFSHCWHCGHGEHPQCTYMYQCYISVVSGIAITRMYGGLQVWWSRQLCGLYRSHFRLLPFYLMCISASLGYFSTKSFMLGISVILRGAVPGFTICCEPLGRCISS